MRKSLRSISLKDLAGLVNSGLKKYGIDAVLTGGACVTIFSNNKYQSLDLDFVTNAAEHKTKEIHRAMKELRFERAAEGFFARKDCPYIVEIIPPPLAIGSEPVSRVVTIRTAAGNLRILSPTDCVKDRLAAFYHWNDPQSLEQALMVASYRRVDLKEIKRWSKVEGHSKKYQEFLRQLKKRK
ncbi:MAG: hypothetical protein JW782_07525 [Candidatus Saganbacteria bacterium]|nr:hypothetical protein [Candidatus Saganbacteria bacterium]